MLKPLLSLVIAAKTPNPLQLARCVSSAASLQFADRIEVLLVLSGECAALPSLLTDCFHRFAVIDVPAEGIYPAYNRGAVEGRAEHVLFFGVDDIVLPGLDDVIARLATSLHPYHLIAAACHMQNEGIVQPRSWGPSLIFHNWCHQGLIYSRPYIVAHPYDQRYCVQADHHMNMRIVSDPSLRYTVSESVVSYFSAGGASASVADKAFRQDFPRLAANAFGRPYGLYVQFRQWMADKLYGDLASRVKT